MDNSVHCVCSCTHIADPNTHTHTYIHTHIHTQASRTAAMQKRAAAVPHCAVAKNKRYKISCLDAPTHTHTYTHIHTMQRCMLMHVIRFRA